MIDRCRRKPCTCLIDCYISFWLCALCLGLIIIEIWAALRHCGGDSECAGVHGSSDGTGIDDGSESSWVEAPPPSEPYPRWLGPLIVIAFSLGLAFFFYRVADCQEIFCRVADCQENEGHAAPPVEVLIVSTNPLHRRIHRVKENHCKLYHATNASAAKQIAKGGTMLRGAGGMFGAGIYFAATPDAAKSKSRNGKEAIITATVALGKSFEPVSKTAMLENWSGQDLRPKYLTYSKLRAQGYDSVWARAKPHGPMERLDEWVVYNSDQVWPIAADQPHWCNVACLG